MVAKIRARIESGQYKRGSRLPTMTAAAEEFGVSTRTVVDAFVILRESGEVIGVPGRGVFVAPEAPDG